MNSKKNAVRSSDKPIPRISSKTAKNDPSQRVHFIGIGGIGMSSLARWFLAQNWLVTGSDASKSSITQELTKDGVRLKIGHKKENLSHKTDLVVASAAIPLDNPEMEAAKERGIKIQRYSEALGEVTKKYKTIAICGSHGKSTTTAMVASILIKAKMDPTVIIGTKLNGWNFRYGKSEWLVIEADEYTGAFWNYHPAYAVCTNIDLEHLDFYKDLNAVKNSFKKFLQKVPKSGAVVMNRDDKNSLDVSQNIKNINPIFFSIKKKKRIEKLRSILKVPGNHNVTNALAAWHIAEEIGVPQTTILSSLSAYKGIWRRLEYKGKNPNGIIIFDDYAHHPTEVKASLKAIKDKYPKKHILTVFQPHQSKRLIALYDDFIKSFGDADSVILIDVYNPKGRDTASLKINSDSLARDINKYSASQKAVCVGSHKNVKKEIDKMVKKRMISPSKTVAVFMGAGDLSDEIPKLIKK
ncbi:MAG: UDP-N-acetylmuramate--L-alanine ligase [Candidatus Colwellbacteria bacterium]|nr:UDP-N-acetylmuramate--L-alanine ligase [Candidatus Colwellbacteria bacterium]